jgi:hypothetical protein
LISDRLLDVVEGMRVWKYRFRGTRNRSVSCWKCIRRASLASISAISVECRLDSLSRSPSATTASKRFNKGRSFDILLCRWVMNPSGPSKACFAVVDPAGVRRGLSEGITMTLGQCDAALRKNGFYKLAQYIPLDSQ